MSVENQEIAEYLTATKYIVLATVNEGDAPALRVLGAFGVKGFQFFYSTKKDTNKVQHTDQNPQVTALFQHENQNPAQFVNVSITGKAVRLTNEIEIDEAVSVIGNRNAKFRENVRLNGIAANQYLYRVDPQEIRILDRRNGAGPDSIKVLSI